MTTALTGRRVLLIAPRFFGYEIEIADELRQRGALVDELPDRPFDSPFMAAVTRFKRSWTIQSADRLYERMLKDFDRPSYDFVIVVNGQTLSPTMLARIRREFPAARFILYMWDSIANRQSVVENLNSFDACFSFDPAASRQFGMTLRPLFFSRGFEARDRKKIDYHLSFVGTAHTDRFAVVSAVDKNLPPNIRRMWYLYLQAQWVFYAYRFSNPDFRGASKSSFRFEPLTKQRVQDIFFRSHAVLDIEHPLQNGLTMRTFEAMGASKKLVTTNPHIREYDFYNSDNICVIDRKAAQVPAAFLDSPYSPLSDELYCKYRLEGWLDELLGGKEKQPTPANRQS
jgi:hypothetical protein